MAMDYNKTLNLPKTDFPMRGNLPKREPETLKKWEEDRLYYKMVENNKGKPSYILHSFKLNRKSVCIPARNVWCTETGHILILNDKIL